MLLAAKRPTRINRHDRASRAAAVEIWSLHPSGGSNKEPDCGISYSEARKAWETTNFVPRGKWLVARPHADSADSKCAWTVTELGDDRRRPLSTQEAR